MAVPSVSTAQSAIAANPAARPTAASTIDGPAKPAFWLRFDPSRPFLADLRDAPDGLKKALGLGDFAWLPEAHEFAAVPGVNGVWSEPGWSPEETLVRGKPALSDEEREAGLVLLDPWTEVPSEFCPPGVNGGSLLRVLPVKNGAHYHTPWGGLRVVDPRQPAVPVSHPALRACWIASLVKAGKIQPASEFSVQGRRAELDSLFNTTRSKSYADAGLKAEKLSGIEARIAQAKAEVYRGQ